MKIKNGLIYLQLPKKNLDKLKEIIDNIFQNDISENGDKVGVKTHGN